MPKQSGFRIKDFSMKNVMLIFEGVGKNKGTTKTYQVKTGKVQTIRNFPNLSSKTTKLNIRKK